MKKIKNIIFSLGLILSMISCEDKSKNPFPTFIEGANLRVIPSPFTLRPALSLASINSSSIAFTFSSENATAIQKVDIFVTSLSVAESNTVGVIPGAAATPVTIAYGYNIDNTKATGYHKLLLTNPARKKPLRTLTAINGDQQFTAADLATASGVALGSMTLNQSFILIFEVTKTDGSVYSYVNSGPGIVANPAPTATEGSDFIPGVIIRIGS